MQINLALENVKRDEHLDGCDTLEEGVMQILNCFLEEEMTITSPTAVTLYHRDIVRELPYMGRADLETVARRLSLTPSEDDTDSELRAFILHRANKIHYSVD